jgi:hypothetical protein
VLLSIVHVPRIFSFNSWAFSSPGSELTVQYLAREGYRPGVDFVYFYGLLPLLVGRVWFGALGITPVACFGAMFVCGLFMVRALARFAVALRLPPIGIAFLILSLPVAIMPIYPHLAQSMEALLLCNALAEQAAGKHSRALALVTAALFAKPSLSYAYGLLLSLIIVRTCWQNRDSFFKQLFSAMLPAIGTALILAITLATVFGPQSLFRTLIPTQGMLIYRLLDYGPSNVLVLLHPPGVRIGYYLGTVAGFWTLGSVWLIGCGIVATRRYWNSSIGDREIRLASEVILCCAFLHLAFVFAGFANPGSWTYYSYILVMGIAATSLWQRSSRYVVGVLAIVAALGLMRDGVSIFRRRHETAANPVTAGLWARADERFEWQSVVRAIAQHPNPQSGCGNYSAVLSYEGGLELIAPGFGKPETAFFLPGLPNDRGKAAKIEQIANAGVIVAPEDSYHLEETPMGRSLLANSELVFKGKYFTVYRKLSCHKDLSAPKRN